ncbi:E3 ubiquitin-protein ligase rnf8-like, partial [Artemia franciscana]|uniref:E3 ubiquitin-protein ligase rnf8-like n=1 Tax=Artemia franciscana TaxID=6661 RepID=UPI0032DB2454
MSEQIVDIRQEEDENKEKLEAFQKKQLDLLETDYSCSICLEVYVKPVRMPCQHIFCKTCIIQWDREHLGCPFCRTERLHKDTLLKSCIDNLNCIQRALNTETIQYFCSEANDSQFFSEFFKNLELLKQRQLNFLQLDLSCSLCHRLLMDPIRMSCNHMFCEICILHWK